MAIARFINVPMGEKGKRGALDADDARRRRLLNIILIAILFLAIPVTISPVNALLVNSDDLTEEEVYSNEVQAIAGGIMIVLPVALYFVNRYLSGQAAGWVLVLFLILAISFADSPSELTGGRSTFFYTLPILVASVVLKPRHAMTVATIIAFIIVLLTIADIYPDEITSVGDALEAFYWGLVRANVATIGAFFLFAVIAWLGSGTLERALQELRVINAELDLRVAQRTQELSVALNDVQSISSKNQAILESIADGVVVFDNKGKATVTNPAMTRLMSLPADKIIGSNIGALTANNIDVLDSHTAEKARRVDVGDRTLSISLAPVRIENSKLAGEVVAVFRDFTREAQLEKMKDTFVSMASHELRTPLNAILGYSDMLREGVYGEMSADQRLMLDRVMANTKRMLSLVNNMLDRAQLAAGRLNLHIYEYPIKEMLFELESVVGVLANNKGLDFKVLVEADVPPLMTGDKERLVQILINLCGNAVKFTTQGYIKVHVTKLSEERWQLAVIDTGRGIPKAALDAIFLPFEQVEDAHTRNVGGTGLGLSIVKMLVELMGGTIALESEMNVGSIFTVVLPIHIVQVEEQKVAS